MMHVAIWYLIVAALGLIAWPLAFRLLPGLPDRGYAFSRALGLMLVGYLHWALGTLGLLQNSDGGILFSALIVAGISIWAYRHRADNAQTLKSWTADHWLYIVAAETLFAAALVSWAFVRAYNPELNSTERPMELAFLNGVVHSATFPPLDPWLAGYSISYYYFGYVLIGVLVKLAGTPVSVGFNVGVSLLFAFTLLNAFGLVYNLAASANPPRKPAFGALIGPLLSAPLGALFVGVMGNLEGLLELLRAWNLPLLGQGFWTWLDLEDLTVPVTRALWPPDMWRFWWWWRASRVIRDRDLSGVAIGFQPIDEFPMFSFILGDMHPHVLALPFVIFALALAFNALAQRESLSKPQIALYAVCFGGLAFLNTWDMPIYFFVLVAALLLRQARLDGRLTLDNIRRPLATSGIVLALGFLAYITWYIGFTSQAGGILPNAIFATRLHQFLVMFGPFLAIILCFVFYQLVKLRGAPRYGFALMLGFGLLASLITIMIVTGLGAIRAETIARNFLLESAGFPLAGLSEAQIEAMLPDAIRDVLAHRLTHPLTSLFLTAIIIGACAILFAGSPRHSDVTVTAVPYETPVGFALILIVTGALLTLSPEFVYLRDNFQQRLNTVFKFYYAAWVLFAVGSAYAAYHLLSRNGWIVRIGLGAVLAIIIAAGLVYPALAIPSKMGPLARGENDPPPTLDGIDYIRQSAPSDYRAIVWLQQNAEPGSIVLEAVGGSYIASFGRVSSATGLPTLIGWPGHESQWRGALFGELAGDREAIVREIYNTVSVAQAKRLLEERNVTYVFVGAAERNPSFASSAGLEKFERFLTAVFRDGDTVIYHAKLPLAEEETP